MVFKIKTAVDDPRCLTLYIRKNGDGVAVRHWLGVEHRVLGGVPHLLLVDHDRLPEVVACLEGCTQRGDAPL